MKKIRHHLCTHLTGIQIHSLLTMYGQQLGGCHVAVELIDFPELENVSTIYEAVSPVCRTMPTENWLGKEYVPVKTWEFIPTESEAADVLKEMLLCVGKPYSHKQIALIAAGEMNHALDEKLGEHDWNGRTEYICSEVMARSAAVLGYAFRESLDTVDLKDIVLANDALFEMRKVKSNV